jgi:hypothetical protein
MRLKTASAALGVTMLTALPHAWAQQPAGGEFPVNSFTPGHQAYPSVASDRDGNFVVVWDDGTVKGQRFDRAGARLGSEFTVTPGIFGYMAAVAMGPKGDFVVVWSQRTAGSGSGIHGRRFDRQANPQGAEFQVNTYATSAERYANVAVDGRGDFVVAWSSYAGDGSRMNVRGQRFDAQGNRRGGEFQVNTYATGLQYRSHVSMDAAGNFVIVWSSVPGTDLSGSSLNGQRYDANGLPRGGEFQVNTYTTGYQFSVGIAHAPDGSFVVAFGSNQNSASSLDVIAKRYDAGGNPIGSEFLVNDTTTNGQLNPDIAMDAQGNFVVSWSGPDTVGRGVYARRFWADGQPRGADFRVNTNLWQDQFLNSFAPNIASDEVGNFIITWWSLNPSGDDWNIYGQRYGGLHPDSLVADPAGNHVWEPGETVEVRPGWFNASGDRQTFAGTLANLSDPAGGAYTIIDGVGDYGGLETGQSRDCSECYHVSVDIPSSRPALHWDAAATETLTPAFQGQQKRWLLHVGSSFTDVPNASPFYRFVETLLHKGVTAGCGGTNYCPSATTTRDQMAVFVLLAKEGAGYTPPACGTPMFNDVPASNPLCKYIQELARRNVVSGCGGGNYCPTSAVTRDQMAIFVLRTLDPALNPPTCGTPVFGDVPASNPFCKWIEELARRGVVSGCGGGNYCPTQPVTREQMGAFITVSFGLTIYGP